MRAGRQCRYFNRKSVGRKFVDLALEFDRGWDSRFQGTFGLDALALATAGLFGLGLAIFFAFMKGLWVPLVPPAMAWFISSATVTACMLSMEKKQRSLLMHLFSRHVSREVADAIWQEREQFMDGGRPRPQRLVASVLFTDFTGFTSVSERLDPQTLMAWQQFPTHF